MFPLDHLESADAAADIDAGTFGFFARRNLESGTLEREIRRRDGQVDEPPHFLDFFFLDVVGRIEALDLAGDAATEIGGVEGGDRTDTALSAPDGLPDRLGADSNRSQHSDSGNYNSALQEGSVNLGCRPTSFWTQCK